MRFSLARGVEVQMDSLVRRLNVDVLSRSTLYACALLCYGPVGCFLLKPQKADYSPNLFIVNPIPSLGYSLKSPSDLPFRSKH